MCAAMADTRAPLPVSEAEIATAARAMQESKAWPVVFRAGVARYLARVALQAAARVRSHEAQHG